MIKELKIEEELNKYKECRRYRKEFNTNLREAKSLIRSKDYKEAKMRINDCSRSIKSISSIVDSLPTHTGFKILYSIGVIVVNAFLALQAFDKVYRYAEKFIKIANGDREAEIYKDELKKITDVATVASLGAATATEIANEKTFKDKTKKMLNKCEKKLEQVKKYLDKAEKMSKEVKESFDETLSGIYDSYAEGTIDEFEYNSLIDHLLD